MRSLSDEREEQDVGHRPPRVWLVPVLVFVVAFAVYAATISHGVISPDLWSANFGSWHLMATGHPWVEGVPMPPLDQSPVRAEWVIHAANGHTVIGRSPGVIAVALPAYWLSHAATMTTVPGGLTAALLTAWSTTMVFLTLRRHLAHREALLAAAVFGFTTPVWSVAANGVWPHTITILGITGMAFAADRDRWWLTGVFGGITLWGRLHAALIVAVLGLVLGWRRRDPLLVLRVATTSCAFLLAMSAWTRWMYGTWNPTASYDTSPFVDYAERNPLDLGNQLGMWISPDRGILVWTPVILLLLPALARAWATLPDWSRALLLGGLAYTFLQGALNRFSGGEFFYGYRLTLELLAAATPALALSACHMGRLARSLFGPVLAVQALAIATGAVTDGGFVGNDLRWTANGFVLLLNEVGPLGWAVVGLAAAVGVLAARIWSGDPADADRGESGQRGKVSTHSVP